MHITKLIRKLMRLYKTNDPFEIARSKNILVIFEDLGSLNGYYKKAYRQKQIHINCNLPEHLQRFVCAHELGHALLHPNSNTPFLKGNTFFVISKMEQEANTFAVELLIPDDELEGYMECTIEQISRVYGYHQKLIELRMNRYKKEKLRYR